MGKIQNNDQKSTLLDQGFKGFRFGVQFWLIFTGSASVAPVCLSRPTKMIKYMYSYFYLPSSYRSYLVLILKPAMRTLRVLHRNLN